MIGVDRLQVLGEAGQGQLRDLLRVRRVAEIQRDQRVEVAEGDRKSAIAQKARGHQPLARFQLGDFPDQTEAGFPAGISSRRKHAQPAAQLETERSRVRLIH